MPEEPKSTEELLDRIAESVQKGGRTSLGEVLDTVGRRSFGPLLAMAGLVVLMPIIGDIPGVPTLMGIFVATMAVQMLVHSDRLWLPDWVLDRSVDSDKLEEGVRRLRKPARFIDRWTHVRWSGLLQGAGYYTLVVLCLAIAAAIPPMELVPFSANGAGIALTLFGIALLTRDGVVASVAAAVVVGTFCLVVFGLL